MCTSCEILLQYISDFTRLTAEQKHEARCLESRKRVKITESASHQSMLRMDAIDFDMVRSTLLQGGASAAPKGKSGGLGIVDKIVVVLMFLYENQMEIGCSTAVPGLPECVDFKMITPIVVSLRLMVI